MSQAVEKFMKARIKSKKQEGRFGINERVERTKQGFPFLLIY